MYMCIYVHTCTYMYIYVHICTCMYIFVLICTYMYVCVHKCTCMYIYVHGCTLMYICVQICTYQTVVFAMCFAPLGLGGRGREKVAYRESPENNGVSREFRPLAPSRKLGSRSANSVRHWYFSPRLPKLGPGTLCKGRGLRPRPMI